MTKPIKAKEMCADCGKIFLGGKNAYLCPQCRKRRVEEGKRKANQLELLSAEPNILDDGTLTITVPHGMLSKVNRVIVDEVGTKFCKTMYQDALPSAEPQIIRCKDCKHRVVNEHYGEKGYFKLKAHCDLDTGDIFELGRSAEEDDWFCADAERRTE